MEVELRQKEQWIALSVRASGDGIDESYRQRIWERFYCVDPSRGRPTTGGGDGLVSGFRFVSGFVEAHGGNVEADSRPGSGSAFTVLLPVSR
ncbi:MAG: hypothetical protein GEU75_07330 [Dehalococcoidia bacterium]|nr:hypothetical protein [Dehalococcoidia bacterium]